MKEKNYVLEFASFVGVFPEGHEVNQGDCGFAIPGYIKTSFGDGPLQLGLGGPASAEGLNL